MLKPDQVLELGLAELGFVLTALAVGKLQSSGLGFRVRVLSFLQVLRFLGIFGWPGFFCRGLRGLGGLAGRV